MDKGESQQLAERWVSAITELEKATSEMEAARGRAGALSSTLADLDKRLHAGIGPNRPIKVFQVADTIVIVEHEKGVRGILKERADG